MRIAHVTRRRELHLVKPKRPNPIKRYLSFSSRKVFLSWEIKNNKWSCYGLFSFSHFTFGDQFGWDLSPSRAPMRTLTVKVSTKDQSLTLEGLEPSRKYSLFKSTFRPEKGKGEKKEKKSFLSNIKV